MVRIGEAAHITWAGGHCTIGASTTHAMLAADEDLRQKAGALWDAANALGALPAPDVGTIGDACTKADPSSDYPTVLLALDACFVVCAEATREIAARDFFKGWFETGLRDGETLVKITFDAAPHSAYLRDADPASREAPVGVAAVLTLSRDTIEDARMAVAGLTNTPFRAASVERALHGVKTNDEPSVQAACAGTSSGSTMAGVVAARSVMRASAAR